MDSGCGKRKFIAPLVCIAAIVCVTVLMFYSDYVHYADTPVDVGAEEQSVTVEISKGSGFSHVSHILRKVDLIRNERLFFLLALAEGALKHIRAGEYELNASMSPREILYKLMKGEVKGYRIPIPEGFTLRQIASRLAEWNLVDETTFINNAHDKELISSYSIVGESIEGYLFPDTYLFNRSMDEKEIILMMVRRFRDKVTSAMIQRAEATGFSLQEIVTLASIIEKEGGLKGERPLIAAVFHNRLRRGMKLQSDPTVIYGIEGFDGNLTRQHLRKRTPYNTYLIKGLPPGPICNPGLDSIMAALYPAPRDYLFFVSRNDGSHHFSTDLASHNEAVVKYQIKRRRR